MTFSKRLYGVTILACLVHEA